MNISTVLNESRATFSYTKADGSLRQATGTTNPALIPESARAESGNTDTSTSVRYYDFDRNGWRQFTRASLVADSVKVEATA